MRRLTLASVLLPFALGAQSAPRLTSSQVRADLAQVRSAFLAVDRSYAPPARSEAERRLAILDAAADTVQRPYLEIELARIAALADNGHTGVASTRWSSRYNRVGVRFTPFGEDFVVLAAHAPLASLLGGQLTAIDGHGIAELRAAARTLRGGTDAWRDRYAGYLFESPELLQAMGLARDATSATYQFRLPNGKLVSQRIVADTADTLRARAQASRWMTPEPPPPDGHEWRFALSAERAPWSVREIATPFRQRYDSTLQAVVAQFRMNLSTATIAIEGFMRAVEGEVAAKKPQHFVLDMRTNGGGNLNMTRAFVQRLATTVPGTIFVLTSPGTFSAAISTVGYLKQAAPDRVVIVGEPVGDRMMFWAEGAPVTLANSQVTISLARERHDYANGCKAYTDCHASVVRNPIAVPTLAPAIAAPWTYAAYVAGRDPGMEAVAAALGSKR